MNLFELEEAQLFRILGGFFGPDNVIPKMSVLVVCGGSFEHLNSGDLNSEDVEITNIIKELGSLEALSNWAKNTVCLFSIIDEDSLPKLVIEFDNSGKDKSGNYVVDLYAVEHQKYARPLLKKHGVNYIHLTKNELNEIINPKGKIDFTTLMNEKLGTETDDF